MPTETPEVREVIKRAIWGGARLVGGEDGDRDLSYEEWRDYFGRKDWIVDAETLTYPEELDLQAERVYDAIAALVSDGVDAAITNYGNACSRYGYFPSPMAVADKNSAEHDLKALIAVAGRVDDEMVLVRREDLAYALLDWREAATDAPPIHKPGGTRPWWGAEDQDVYDRLQAALAKEQEDV